MARIIERQLVRVWNVNLMDGREVKAATIEQGPRQLSMCDGCPTPCCKGILRPILTQEEFLSKKFKTTFISAPNWLRKQVPRADFLVCIALTERGCPYHEWDTNKCLIWPNAPQSCLSYDCREDPRMRNFVGRREKEWLSAPIA